GPTFTDFKATDPNGCSRPITIQPNMLKSVTILSPSVSLCEPRMDIVKDVSGATWAMGALVCLGEVHGDCPADKSGMARADSALQGKKMIDAGRKLGYMQCIQKDVIGDEDPECPPDGPYSYSITLFRELDNEASCAPCQCDFPMGSICTAAVTAYRDMSCD